MKAAADLAFNFRKEINAVQKQKSIWAWFLFQEEIMKILSRLQNLIFAIFS